MPEMYARCNNFMSGATMSVGVPCKHIVKGESEQEVMDEVIKHLSSVHNTDGNEMINTIKRCIFTKGTKAILNRGPV